MNNIIYGKMLEVTDITEIKKILCDKNTYEKYNKIQLYFESSYNHEIQIYLNHDIFVTINNEIHINDKLLGYTNMDHYNITPNNFFKEIEIDSNLLLEFLVSDSFIFNSYEFKIDKLLLSIE